MCLANTNNTTFSFFSSKVNQEEMILLNSNSIDSFQDLLSNVALESPRDNGNPISHYDGILSTNIINQLQLAHPEFVWNKLEDVSISSVSGNNIINMQGAYFPQNDIEEAINQTGVTSNYGGCGPIAMMGVLDFFARFLGYNEIMEDPTSQEDRIELACDVLNNIKTYEVGFIWDKGTFTFPWDYSSSFNSLISQYGLSNKITSTYYWTLLGGQKTTYLSIIENNIKTGLPVTLGTSFFSGDGDYAQHYTNIYGYEKWRGHIRETGEILDYVFLKSRLNFFDTDNDYCCNANILNDAMLTIITYSLNSYNDYIIYASDFSNEFVNTQGQGQYFFYPIDSPVVAQNNVVFQTQRLRCSYIENQYLVLSPKRFGAGTAYLDMAMPTHVSKLIFNASMWGNDEQISGQSFMLQFKKNGQWQDHVAINLSTLSTNKNNPNSIVILFPKNTTQFRFYSSTTMPYGDRNRGRIVLDNMHIQYH